MTIYIRTKALFEKGDVKEDGTIEVTRKEMYKLGAARGVDELVRDVNGTVFELKRKGEIKGYGDNFKVLRKEGMTQLSLLEDTGVRKRKRKRKEPGLAPVEKYLVKIGRGGGSKRFKDFLSSKPMDKFFSTKP